MINISQADKRFNAIFKDSSLPRYLKDYFFKNYPDEFFIAADGQSYLNSLTAFMYKIIHHHESQLKEVLELRKILGEYYPIKPTGRHIVYHSINKIKIDKKKEILQKLDGSIATCTTKNKIDHHQFYESLLNDINGDIAAQCLLLSENIKDSGYTKKFIDLSFALTRLSSEVIELIHKHANNGDDNCNIILKLSSNHLGWLPESLCEIPNVSSLHLDNNILSNLPKAIVNWNSSLMYLYLSNFSLCNSRCIACRSIIRRTAGNHFQTLPESIYMLKNLKHLNMINVGLEELPVDKLLDSLTALSSLNILKNHSIKNLPKIVDDKYSYNQRIIQIYSHQ